MSPCSYLPLHSQLQKPVSGQNDMSQQSVCRGCSTIGIGLPHRIAPLPSCSFLHSSFKRREAHQQSSMCNVACLTAYGSDAVADLKMEIPPLFMSKDLNEVVGRDRAVHNSALAIDLWVTTRWLLPGASSMSALQELLCQGDETSTRNRDTNHQSWPTRLKDQNKTLLPGNICYRLVSAGLVLADFITDTLKRMFVSDTVLSVACEMNNACSMLK